jgi:cytochrome c peroxidase
VNGGNMKKMSLATAMKACCVLGVVGFSAAPALAQNGREIAERLRRVMLDTQGTVVLPPPATEEDFPPRNLEKESLGKFLFYDKVISGNMNISCATCHHGLAGTGDGLSLPVGEGGAGLGITRNTGFGIDAVPERVPRNAPFVFNLAANDFTRMFHDGRVEVDTSQPSGFATPAGDDLPLIMESVLAAQAMFPPTSGTEMAGQAGENPIGDAATAGDVVLVWELIAQRLRDIPEYVDLFVAAFDDITTADDITFAHAANAIAAYEGATFRAINTPFDRYLRGEQDAMSESAARGMNIFYGVANCLSCHSGTYLSDQDFHAIAMPQIGPGKGHNLPGFDGGLDDLGREGVTGDGNDRLKFRTPPLRNVALTGPWGHNGAYNTLEAVVRHHLNTDAGMRGYDTDQAVLPSRPDLDEIDFLCYNDQDRRRVVMEASELRRGTLSQRGPLSDEQFADLMDFLHALTDPASVDLRHTVPMTVPSGIPVFD